MLNLSPLCGGVPPELAWPYLKRVGEVVMPEAASRSWRRAADGLDEALNELIVDEEDVTVTGTSAVDLYYDPYDFAIDDDPYPVWKRLRDEAPLYYNEKYNFYALSRYEDVARELPNWETYRSGRGTTMDIIMSGIEVPPGVILFEDPPLHDLHRRLLSRVFTPRRMEAIEPLTRQFCVRALDPLVGSGRFDFIADLGAQIPMRTIGYLLGIPEEDQETIRDNTDHAHRPQGRRVQRRRAPTRSRTVYQLFADYIDWRAEHPSDDLMTQLLNAEIEDDGEAAPADPHRGAHVHQHGRRRRQRDHHAADRLHRSAAGRAPGPAARAGRRSLADPGRHRGGAALRGAVAGAGPIRRPRHRMSRTRQIAEGSVMLLLNGSANRDERHFPTASASTSTAAADI